jgi:lipopolysaccharide export system protein LptA
MSGCARLTIVAAAWAGALFLAPPGVAQTLSNTFGGLSESSDQPIDIESDVLMVYDAQKYAKFKGNVKAVQGTTTLRARELDVHYVGGGDRLTGKTEEPAAPVKTAGAGAKAEGDKGTQITKIEAKGDVIVTSEDDQTTTSDWALYDVPAQLVTVGGNVVLTQGQNVLKGDRLIIDLKTGESRFENKGNTTAGGRIRALFMPKQGATGGGERTGDGASDEAKPADSADGDKPEAAKPAKPKSASDAGAKPSPPPEDSAPIEIMPEYR